MPVRPARSTPATAKAEETRERILGAALELFRTRGFDQTTMRDVAAGAGVAIGGAYYYFRSKEELVMAFYLRTTEESRETLPAALAKTKDLERRLRILIDDKLAQFTAHRSFLGALARSTVDPSSPLSPFGEETASIREESIGWFRQAVEGSSASVPKDLQAELPRLLWLYHMGIILFWLYDRSPAQRKTKLLIAGTLGLIVKGLALIKLPLMGGVRRGITKLLRDVAE